jgi:hypothetical protein
MTDALGKIWPDTLKIRDCKIHDDIGGSGKRIYTTAGNGYERKEYTRTDISQERIAQLEAALVYYRDEYCEHGGDLCGRLSSDVCGGCNAATALKAKP